MMRFLIYSVALLVLSSSCATFKFPNAVGMRESTQQELNNFYLDTTQTYVYRFKMQAFKQAQNGNLLIEAVSPETHRIALVSDFGQTLFDMSIYPERYDVHYVMPDMNKKLLLNEVADIFRTLTTRRYAESALLFMDKQHFPVYVVGDSYYTLQERHVAQILQTKNGKERFKVAFLNVEQRIAKSIHVTHSKYPITLDFELDRKQSNL
ncbi:hypothetical protein [Sphingobacterium deserti]|uniref:Lipoprotein n=1 Tax=Sphingobacterium deserti TaxID=1229276 RepID=A0A0B8T1H8_9SPHI|nr:hypothetical protein [Sphingobacterium deserti]KGE14837.1 hypothetical protein DI53_1337 [Sphingobacterium deserti]